MCVAAAAEGDVAAVARDCEGASSMSIFVAVMILIWGSAQLCRLKLLPAVWPRTHTIMTANKKDKAVGYAIKTSVRFLVLVNLTCLMGYLSFDGLAFPIGVNATTGQLDECSGHKGYLRRLWHSSRMFFLAIMCWELSLMPMLAWDMWLHRVHAALDPPACGYTTVTTRLHAGYMALSTDPPASVTFTPASSAAWRRMRCTRHPCHLPAFPTLPTLHTLHS